MLTSGVLFQSRDCRAGRSGPLGPRLRSALRRGITCSWGLRAIARGDGDARAHALPAGTQRHAEQIGESAWKGEETFFSVDAFLYARCAAVANGRAFFERALAQPRNMPRDVEFEALLYAAGAAYQRRTRKEWDHQTGCSYETFSNRKGWAQPTAPTGGAAPPRSSR